jgi:hypothetical protein
MNGVQASFFDAVSDRPRRQPLLDKLAVRDDPMLSSHQRPEFTP